MTRDQCATMRGTRLSCRREYFDMERGAGGSAGERALEQAYYKARGRKPKPGEARWNDEVIVT